MAPDKAAQSIIQVNPRQWVMSWRTWLGVVISLLCLWLVLRGTDLQQTGAALLTAHPGFITLSIFTVLLTNLVKALRWRILFPRRSQPPLSRLTAAIFIGQFLNLAIPARLGEIGRAYLLRGPERSASLSFGTIVAEKWADILALLVGWLIVLPFLPMSTWYMSVVQTLVIAALVSTTLLAGLAWWPATVLHVAQRLSARSPLPKQWQALGLASLTDILQGLQTLRSFTLIIRLLLWTIPVWGLATVTNWLVLHAVAELPPSWPLALLLLVVLQSGIGVPSSPGRVGVFHYLALLSLSAFGFSGDVAVAYAFLLHLVVLGTITVAGLIGLLWESWRRRTIGNLSRAQSRAQSRA